MPILFSGKNNHINIYNQFKYFYRHDQKKQDADLRGTICHEPLQILVHGGPGTGKSFLTKCIFQKTKEIGYSVRCEALRTIHNLFSFSIEDLKSSTNLPALSIQAINDLKLRLKPDEVSYISPEFLGHLDKRLQQLTGKKGVPYGGINL